MNKREIGKNGEELAVEFLEKSGIQIIERNYFSKFGEIDLIGFENQTIIFIEVKLRNNIAFGSVYESITEAKIKRIFNSAEEYLSETNITYDSCRFDIIFINFDQNSNNYKIEWIKNQNFN